MGQPDCLSMYPQIHIQKPTWSSYTADFRSGIHKGSKESIYNRYSSPFVLTTGEYFGMIAT